MTNEATRFRKAWLVKVRGYDDAQIEYGATASKVRHRVRMYFDHDVPYSDIDVRRDKSADQHLPAPCELALSLTQHQRDALLHAHGSTCGDVMKAGFREHYCTDRNDPTLCALERLGLMRVAKHNLDLVGGNVMFLVTERGKKIANSLTPEYNP